MFPFSSQSEPTEELLDFSVKDHFYTQPSETSIFHFDKIALFVLQIDLCRCREARRAKKKSEMK